MNEADDQYRTLRRLPPFPSVATKLVHLLEDDNVSVKKIMDLIKRDTTLTAELLRIVKSPIYGFSTCISSLQTRVPGWDFKQCRALLSPCA